MWQTLGGSLNKAWEPYFTYSVRVTELESEEGGEKMDGWLPLWTEV